MGGKYHSDLFLTNIYLVLVEKLLFSVKSFTMSNFVSDNKYLLFGLSDGSLHLMSWKGEFFDTFGIPRYNGDLDEAAGGQLSSGNGYVSDSNPRISCSNFAAPIVYLELSLPLRLLIVVYSVGRVAICSLSKNGLRKTDSIKAERWLDCHDAMCAAVASEQQLLAIGCRRGAVQLYDIAEGNESLLRTVSLYDWRYSVEDTGSVSCIAWSPDNTAFAVGWKCRGLAVWSASGCRLMCTIRQIGISSVSFPIVKPNVDFKYEPLVGGTLLVQWDEYGYRLYAVEERSTERILAFSFVKCCLNRGISGTTDARQVIYSDDHVMVVQSEDTDELKITHLNIPVSYVSQSWPILHVVASKDGMYLAIAGLHELILYDIRSKRWRVFGDLTQEQMIQCKGLLWLGKIVVMCNYRSSSATSELLFHPRYHLDQSSLLCRKALLGKAVVMDVLGDYILVTYRPFDVHIIHLSTVRELSIMSAKSHPTAMRFIPDQLGKQGLSVKDDLATSSKSAPWQPTRCLTLRTNGELSLLDLDDGHERELSDSVELFWVTCGLSEERANLIEEVSWIDYGHRGMQVWYPSHGVLQRGFPAEMLHHLIVRTSMLRA